MESEIKSLTFYINKLIQKKELSYEESSRAIRIIMSDEATPISKAVFLTALQTKEPTAGEIAAFALTIRQMAKRVEIKGIDENKIIADTCGTGGGGIKTFNISTAIMFILSAADLIVAKHGNRAITSECGSADVLESLGVNVNMAPDVISHCLSEIGVAFLFAPLFHPAFKNVQGIRRDIGVPTIFNILGPLLNPAFACSYEQGIRMIQILGVNDQKLIKKIISVLKIMKLYRAMVVYGQDKDSKSGMDEISTLGDTVICELTSTGEVKEYIINPQDFGIRLARPADLTGGSPADNARILLDILSGRQRGPRRDIVVMNAAAGLYLGCKARDLREGIKLANEYIDSGAAFKKMELLRQFSQEC